MVTDNMNNRECDGQREQPPETKAKTDNADTATALPQLKKHPGSCRLEVLSYQNVKNSTEMQYVRVPTNSTEESFMKNSA